MLDRDTLNHYLTTLFGLGPLEEPEFALLQELVGRGRAALDGSLHPDTSRKILALASLMPGVSFVIHSAGGAWEKWLESFHEAGLDAVAAIPDGASPSAIRRVLDEARQGHHHLVSISRGILGDVEIDRALPVVAQDRGIFCVVLEAALLGELDRRCFAEIVEEVDRSFASAGVAVFLGAPEGYDLAAATPSAPLPRPSSPDSLTEEEKAALFSPIDFGAYAEADGEGEEEIFDEEELLRTVIREPVRRPAAPPPSAPPPPPLGGESGGAPSLDAILDRADLEPLSPDGTDPRSDAPDPIGELSPLDAILSRAEGDEAVSGDDVAELPADLLIAEDGEGGAEGFDELLGLVTQAGTARVPEFAEESDAFAGESGEDALDALLSAQQAEAEAEALRSAEESVGPILSDEERVTADQASSLLDALLANAEEEPPAEMAAEALEPIEAEGGEAAVQAASEREQDLASLLASFGGEEDEDEGEDVEIVEVLDEGDEGGVSAGPKSLEDTFRPFDPAMRAGGPVAPRDESSGAVSRVVLPGDELQAPPREAIDAEAGNVTSIVLPEDRDRLVASVPSPVAAAPSTGAPAAGPVEEAFPGEAPGLEDEGALEGIDALLDEAEATLGEAPFGDEAALGEAPFGDEAPLGEAPFGDEAALGETPFGDEAALGEAPFVNEAVAEEPSLVAEAALGEAPFGDEAALGEAPFVDEAALGEAPFVDEAALGEAPFGDEAALGEAPFVAEAALGEAPFVDEAALGEAPFQDEAASGAMIPPSVVPAPEAVIPVEASATEGEVDALESLLDQVLVAEGAEAPPVEIQGTAALEAFLATGEMPSSADAAPGPASVSSAGSPEPAADLSRSDDGTDGWSVPADGDGPDPSRPSTAEDVFDAELLSPDGEAILASVGVGAPDGEPLPPPRPEEGSPLAVEGAEELLSTLGLDAPDSLEAPLPETPDEELAAVLADLGEVDGSPLAPAPPPGEPGAISAEGGGPFEAAPVFDEASVAAVFAEAPAGSADAPAGSADAESPVETAADAASDAASAEAIEEAIRRLAQEELAEQIEVEGTPFDGETTSVFGQPTGDEVPIFGQAPAASGPIFGQAPRAEESSQAFEEAPSGEDFDPDSPEAIEAALRRLAEEELAEELHGASGGAVPDGGAEEGRVLTAEADEPTIDPNSPGAIEDALRRLAEEELAEELRPTSARALPAPPVADEVGEEAVPSELLDELPDLEVVADEQLEGARLESPPAPAPPSSGGDSLEAIEEALRRLAEEEVREEAPVVAGAAMPRPASLALPPPPAIEAPELSSDVDALLADLGLDEDLAVPDEEVVARLESELADVGTHPTSDDGALPPELAEVIGDLPSGDAVVEETAPSGSRPRKAPGEMSLDEILGSVELVEPEAPGRGSPDGGEDALDDFLVSEGLAPEKTSAPAPSALPSVEDLLSGSFGSEAISADGDASTGDPEAGRLTSVILPDEDLAASLAALSEDEDGEEGFAVEGAGDVRRKPEPPSPAPSITNVILPDEGDELVADLPEAALVPEPSIAGPGEDPEEGTVTSVVLPEEDLAASLAALAASPDDVPSAGAVSEEPALGDPEEGRLTSVILPDEDLAASLAALSDVSAEGDAGDDAGEDGSIEAALAALDTDLDEIAEDGGTGDDETAPSPEDDFGLFDALQAMEQVEQPGGVPSPAVPDEAADEGPALELDEALPSEDGEFELPEGIDLGELDALDGPSPMAMGGVHEIEEISLADELAELDAAEAASAPSAPSRPQEEGQDVSAEPGLEQDDLDADLATLQGTLQGMLDGFDDDLTLGPAQGASDEVAPSAPPVEETAGLPADEIESDLDEAEPDETLEDLLGLATSPRGGISEPDEDEDVVVQADSDGDVPPGPSEEPVDDEPSLEELARMVEAEVAAGEPSLEELAGGPYDGSSDEDDGFLVRPDEPSLEDLARMVEAEVDGAEPEARVLYGDGAGRDAFEENEISLEDLIGGDVPADEAPREELGALPDLRPDDYLPPVEEEAEELQAPPTVEDGTFGEVVEDVDLSLSEIAAGAAVVGAASAVPSQTPSAEAPSLPVEQAFDLHPELRRFLFDLRSDFAAILEEAALLRDGKGPRLLEVEEQAVQVARAYPEHAAAAFVAGVLLVWERHSMEGLVFLERCGELTAASGDHGNRLVLFEFLSARFPEDLGIRERLAEVHRDRGELDEAAAVWCALGEALEDGGSPSGAQRYYDLAAALLPDRGDVLGRAVAALRSRGKEEEALSRIKAFLDAHPDDPFVLVEKGIALDRNNRGAEAARLFDRAIKIAWEGADDLLVLRQAFLRGGQDGRAAACLERAGVVDPTHEEVRAAHAVVTGGFISTEDLLGEAEAILEAPGADELVESYELPEVAVQSLYDRARRGGAKGLRKIDELERLEAEIGRSASLEEVADSFLAELLRRFIEVGDLLRAERPVEAKLFYERGRSYLQYFSDPTVLFLWSEQVEKKLALVEKEQAA